MLRSLNVDLHQLCIDIFISRIITGTQTYFNVIIHFLWEGPVEPWHPSLVAAVVAWTTSITIPQWVFKNKPIVVLKPTCYSRLAVVVLSNKIRWSSTGVLGTGTVECTIVPSTVIIWESSGIWPEMLPRRAISDGNSINIVGVDIITTLSKSIKWIVLVAPCLSTDLAVEDAISGIGDPWTSWSCR